MRTILTSILILCTCIQATAQDFFEWSSAGENVRMRIQDLTIHPKGIIASIDCSTAQGMPHFFQSDAEEYEFNGYWLNHQLVLFYTPEGKIKWYKALHQDYSSLQGVAISPKQEIVLLVNIKYEDVDENQKPVGYLPTLTSSTPHPAGYSLIFLTSEGKLKKIAHAEHLRPVDMEVTRFLLHPNGHFVLGGAIDEGKPALNLEPEALSGGGDFLMSIDTNGVPQWCDVISYRKNTCCTRVSERNSISVAPDGTIYFGGTYQKGGIFTNGLQTLAPKKYDQNYAIEAYIVSYTPDGKIKWIKTYEDKSILYALEATDKGVFAAHHTDGNIAFGIKADTSANKKNGIAFINKRGKIKWNHMFPVEGIKDMAQGKNGDVVAVVKIGRQNADTDLIISGQIIDRKTDIALIQMNSAGAHNLLKSANLPLQARNEYLLLKNDSKHNIYLAGLIWCGLPMDLSVFGSNLPPVECYGGAAILGKINME